MYDAESALRQATLQSKTAQSQYEVLMLRPRPQAIAEAKTRIDVAQTAVDTAKAQVEQLTIRSPIAGVLNSLTCQLGQTLSVGTAVGEVVDSRRLNVVVWLSVADAQRREGGANGPDSRLRCGRPGPCRDRGQSEGHRQGGRSADGQSPRSHPGRKRRRQADARPGRFGNDRRPRGKSLSPCRSEAVHDLGEGSVISVVRDGKTVVLHDPKLGLKDEHWIEVGGTDLKPDEPVVVEGGYNLPEGTEVAVEKVERRQEGRRSRKRQPGRKPRKADHDRSRSVSSSSSSHGPGRSAA